MKSQSTQGMTSDQRWQLPPMGPDEIRSLPAVVDFVDAARALRLQRSTAYELARTEQFPVLLLRHGRTRRARRVDLLAYLGIAEEQNGGTAA